MAGAPRTIMSRMAAAVCLKSRVRTSWNSCGNRRCSISTTSFVAASKVTVRKWRVWPRKVTFMVWKSISSRRRHFIPHAQKLPPVTAHFAAGADVGLQGLLFGVDVGEHDGFHAQHRHARAGHPGVGAFDNVLEGFVFARQEAAARD